MKYEGLIVANLYEPRLRYPGRKGIYPIIQNHNEIFRRLSKPPIIANDLDLDTPEGREKFNQLVYSVYEGDVFSNVPTCPCMYWHGGDVAGETCPKCGNLAISPTEQPIQPLIWLRAPKGVAGFMNPRVYSIFKKLLRRGSICVLDWLLDPKYRPPVLHAIELDMLNELGVERGITYFINNFDEILRKLVASKRRITKPGGAKTTITLMAPKTYEVIQEFLELYRDCVFSQYLPFPSKLAFVVEKVSKRTFIDPDMTPAVNALISMAKAERMTTSRSTLDSRTARGIRDMDEYYRSVDKDKIFGKEGVARKLMYGFEPHFCMRAVITSIHEPHDHEQIHIPWGSSILMLKLHIANKLLRDDYTPNEINTLIYDNILRKNPKINAVLDELIAETPGGRGIPMLNTRFPSLYHGSTQRQYAQIDRDPANLSTRIPIGNVRGMNADFDGDYTSLLMALDKKQANWFERMAPSTGLMDLTVPYRVSDNPMTSVPVLSTINHMLWSKEQQCRPYGES